jgi:hypothetical protein
MNYTIDLMTIILILLLITILALLYYIFYLNRKLDKFLSGVSTTNLDESITSIKASLVEFEKFKDDMQTYLLTVERRLKKSVQTISTIRFNPFKGTGSGSNQSFSTVFLNEERDGVIISSLYSREHISVYSKPIKAGNPEYELSDEEKVALKEAKNNLTSSIK